jgi:hypothetical protein
MDEDEVLVCSDCAMESTDESQAEAFSGGWEWGEFGPRCPGCVSENAVTNGSEGLAAVGEALNLEKVREAKPAAVAVSFDARQHDRGFGGCVDYDPDYLKNHAPGPPELPKPDTFITEAPAPKKRGRPKKVK